MKPSLQETHSNVLAATVTRSGVKKVWKINDYPVKHPIYIFKVAMYVFTLVASVYLHWPLWTAKPACILTRHAQRRQLLLKCFSSLHCKYSVRDLSFRMRIMPDSPRRPNMKELTRKQPDYQLRKRLGMSLPNLVEDFSLTVPVRHLSFQKSDKGSTLNPGLLCYF